MKRKNDAEEVTSNKLSRSVNEDKVMTEEMSDALYSEYLGMIRKLITQEGVGVNIKEREDEDRALIMAARFTKSCVEIASLLIELKANVNEKNGNGHTALYFAIFNLNVELAEVLLDAGATFDSDIIVTILIDAIDCYLLETENDIEKFKAIIVLLQDHGADIDCPIGEGETSLSRNRSEIDPPRNIGDTPVMVALYNHMPEIACFLVTRDAEFDYESFMIAVNSGHAGTVRTFLDHGANVNAFTTSSDFNTFTGCYYITVLESAAVNGYAEIVNILLEEGSDIDRDSIYSTISLIVNHSDYNETAYTNQEVINLLIVNILTQTDTYTDTDTDTESITQEQVVIANEDNQTEPMEQPQTIEECSCTGVADEFNAGIL